MSDLEKKARIFSNTEGNQSSKLMREVEYDTGRYVGYLAGFKDCEKEYEEKLRWITANEESPVCELNEEDGIYYSKYLELKVKRYDYPLIGYYTLANDDQFFYIISEKDDDIKQEDITHFRECFL